jgi:predicted dienelactone hydrolase
MTKLFSGIFLSFFLAVTAMPVFAVGFQTAKTVDADGRPIAIDIWYPSDAKPTPQTFGPFHPNVAVDGAVSGRNLPLVLFSHGTGGSALSHYDTAMALATAGFVVVTFDHPGDNYDDQSSVGSRRNLIDRPRQARAVLDYVLDSWPQHQRIDSTRIGMFGFSLGGFTTLVAIGGTPDLSRTALLCTSHPEAPDCGFVRDHHGDPLDRTPTGKLIWQRDDRIKVAVVVAPAASFTFGPGSLEKVRAPVQLWSGGADKQAPAQWNSGVVKAALPTPPETHAVPTAGHLAFLTPEVCSEAPTEGCTAFHETFNASVVAFFQNKLTAGH